MQVEQLKEFIVFTRYLNFTKAAMTLNMTQSNLSKRIRLLEEDLGFTLVERGKKLSLTAAGSYFLSKSNIILRDLDTVIEECRSIEQNSIGDIQVQDPPYNDDAAREYYRFIESFMKENSAVPVKFTRMRHATPEENLLFGNIDLSLVYNFGDSDSLVEQYREKGFIAAPLCEQSLVLCCSNQHKLAQRKTVRFKDLKNTTVMTSNGTYSPLRYALADLFDQHNISLQFDIYNTTLQSEFFFAESSTSVYLLPEPMRNDARLSARTNMVFIPFEEQLVSVTAFAIACLENPSNKASLIRLHNKLSE